jgi:hypothetical protein
MTLTAKMDELGKPAWIAATVLGFVIWWPVGLATLAFVIWSGRMGCGHHGHWNNRMERMQAKMDRLRERMGQGGGFGGGFGGGWSQGPSSGNRAFDEYRADTLRRLEEEQREFRDFLGRLRMAKDKAEFDQFMAERRNGPADTGPQPQAQ